MNPTFKFLGITLYYWGYILAFAADFLFSILWYRKKYGFSKLKAFLATALVIPFGYGLIILMGLISGGGALNGVNWVRAVLFIPPAVWLICLILKTNFAKTIDFLTPVACINHGVSHYFCVFQGCCYGYPANGTFSVWNQEQNARLFPIQLIEAPSILLVCVFIVLYAKKKNYDTHGKAYPIHMVLFGLTRFVYEFFRDNTAVRWQLSEFQYYCIAEFAVGVIGLVLINYVVKNQKFRDKHPLLVNEEIDEITRLKKAFSKKKTL